VHLPTIFEKYNSYSLLSANWNNFGSNGHKYQPSSVVEGFSKRAIKDSRPIFSHKSIFKGSDLIHFDVHTSNVRGDKIHFDGENADLIINHYAIQSFDFFMRIKATRGDVNNWANTYNIKRDEEYFERYDTNDIYDDRLYIQNKDIIENKKNI
jgi:hypothetical protein